MRVDERQVRLYFDDQIVVCAPDLQMSRHLGEGYVVADTRLASGYRIRVGGVEPALLGAERTAPHAARFEFTTPVLDAAGGMVAACGCRTRRGHRRDRTRRDCRCGRSAIARRGTRCASRDPPASYPLADSKKGLVPLAWSVTSTTPVSSGTASRMATSMPWLRVTVAMPQPWHPPPRRR